MRLDFDAIGQGHYDGEVRQRCRECGAPISVWRKVVPFEWSQWGPFIAPCFEPCGCEDRQSAAASKLKEACIPRLYWGAKPNQCFDGGYGWYIWGPSRNGKTTNAAALAIRALGEGRTVRFATSSDIARPRLDDGFIEAVCNVSVLVIDDIGKAEMTEKAVAKLFQVLDARYASGKQAIITSNHSMPELARLLAQKSSADTAAAIAARISAMCVSVEAASWN